MVTDVSNIIHVRLAGYAQCWTDMMRWTETLAQAGCLTASLAAFACSDAGPLAKADAEAQRLGVAPTPPIDRQVGLFGAAFRIPAECAIDCISCVLPPEGSIHCWEPSGSQDLSGTFTVDDKSALEPGAPTIQGSQQVGMAVVYWGESADQSRYCAVARRPAAEPDAWRYWQFCTRSADPTVRGLLRGIAASITDDPQNLTPTPCSGDV
jgi:hypothetical protein